MCKEFSQFSKIPKSIFWMSGIMESYVALADMGLARTNVRTSHVVHPRKRTRGAKVNDVT